jgi:hypothetical protein
MTAIFRYGAFAEEASYNENPAPEPDFFVDITGASLDAPSDTEMIYGGGLGRSAFLHRPGFYSPAGNVVYAFDVRTIAFLLKWALGEYVYTAGGGTGALNLHECYGTEDDILPSFCARIGKDLFEHVFSGCCLNQLQLQMEGEFCVATADIIAAVDAKDTLRAIADVTLPTEYPLAFHEATAYSVSGSYETEWSANVKSLTLTINNNLSAEAGRTIGTRYPRRIPANERLTTFAANLWFDSDDELEKLWGGASGPAATGPAEGFLRVVLDGGAGGEVRLDLPKYIYTQVQQQPSGRSELVQAVTGRAFPDTVTLEDGVTDVSTDIYARIENAEETI